MPAGIRSRGSRNRQYLGHSNRHVSGRAAYLNPFAALPLIKSLIDMGVMPGAGFAFLVAGAVTSLPAAIAVFALVKRPMFLWYIGLALTGALASGLLYQLYAG